MIKKNDIKSPKSYDHARDQFLNCAKAAGAIIKRIPYQCESDSDLTVDVAIVGKLPCKRLIITTSGIHGVEGYIGSFFQCHWLRFKLPPDTAIMHIHAVNPWGMKHFSRYNEHGVDINRNYFQPDAVPINSEYAKTAEGIIPTEWRFKNKYRTVRRLIKMAFDKPAIMSMIKGQYTDPNGIYYGGNSRQQSLVILHNLLKQYVGVVEQISYIDLHTGIGNLGDVNVLAEVESEAEYEKLQKNFRGMSDVKKITPDTLQAYTKHGNAMHAFRDIFGDSLIHAITFEIGTRSLFSIMYTLIADKCLRASGKPKDLEAAQRLVEDTFYPMDDRDHLLKHFANVSERLWLDIIDLPQ